MRILARSVMMNRWRNGLVCYLAGALFTLGFAPYHFWPVIFLSLPMLYIQLTTSDSYRQAIWRGFSFGYGFYMVGTWWIANALLVDAEKFGWLLPFSVLGLSAVMALWFIVFAALVHYGRARPSILTFAGLWVIVEVLRSLGIFGFPWNLAGYMALASLPIAQLAAHVGVYGLSFIITLLGLLPVYMMGEGTHKRSLGIITLLLLGASYGYGSTQLAKPNVPGDVTIRVVQPSIPQDIKSAREGREMAVEVLGELSSAPGENGKVPDIVIWPETAYPFSIESGLRHPVPKNVKLLLTGAVRREITADARKVWNSFVALDSNGDVLAHYDKHQLVPFGEFVPLRSVLPLDKITPGDIDFSRGEGPKTMSLDGIPKFSPLICYEAIFPWIAIDETERPEWIINVTNDGWYGDTAGPYQHFDMVRMRAIEQGMPVLRVANSGISALIDAHGRIINALQLNHRGYFDAVLPR